MRRSHGGPLGPALPCVIAVRAGGMHDQCLACSETGVKDDLADVLLPRKNEESQCIVGVSIESPACAATVEGWTFVRNEPVTSIGDLE